MLETVIVVLLLLWLLGFVVAPLAGNTIHILLVLVLLLIIVRVMQDR